MSRHWPVQIDLFATSANHRCSNYFSPYRDPQSAGTDAFLQSWDGLQAYAFPPFSIIPRVIAKLREPRGMELTLVAPHWPQRPWFPDLLQLSLAPPVVLPTVPTSCSYLGLVFATWISTGYSFMPGQSPALHQSGGFLVGGSCAGFLGTPSIFMRQLPAQVDGLPVLVLCSWSFGFSSDPVEGGRFSVLVAVCQRPVSLPSGATAQCCLRSSSFTSRPCPQILSCVTSFGPSVSPRRSAFCVLLCGICLWFSGSSTRRRSSLFLGLHFMLCRRKRCFCWPSLQPNELVSYRLFPALLPLWV